MGQAWQALAWRFYGGPVGDMLTGGPGLVGLGGSDYASRLNQGAIGEVRFAMGWMAFQCGRVEWDIRIDGNPVDEENRHRLMEQVATTDTTVMIATNLMVAGELHYAAFDKSKLTPPSGESSVGLRDVERALTDAGASLPQSPDGVWLPISVIFPGRQNVLKTASAVVRGVWSHPANPATPDPPLRGVLDVMMEIEQLSDLAWAQNRSRIAQMGILQVAQEFSFIGPDNGSNFQQRFEEAANARIADPRATGGAPVIVTGPAEVIGGDKGIRHTTLSTDLDESLEQKMRFAIQRLAWGFPIPPEILLGMTATNRATAFQIEESTYEGHIEPIAKIVGKIYAQALAQILIKENGEEARVEVIPDPTNLLARKHSVPDLQWAYLNALITAKPVLNAMGIEDIPENRATQDDIDRIVMLKSATVTGDATPDGEEPAPTDKVDDEGGQPTISEAVAAAASPKLDLETLTAELANVDLQLLSALTAAAERDIEATFSRLGAQIRTKARGTDVEVPSGKNVTLPFKVGLEGIRALGIDLDVSLISSYMSLGEWWRDKQLPAAFEQVRALLLPLGHAVPSMNGQPAKSADHLVHGLVEWSKQQIAEKDWPLEEAPVDLFRECLSVSGQA